MLEENKKKFQEGLKKKAARSGKSAGPAQKNIANFNWDDMERYSEEKLMEKMNHLIEEISDNKSAYVKWKKDCADWEKKRRSSGYL